MGEHKREACDTHDAVKQTMKSFAPRESEHFNKSLLNIFLLL